MDWIKENFKNQLEFGFPITKKLYSKQSDFQKVEIFDSPTHGKILLNDDCFMITERDEFIYHEMIVHVPMQALDNRKKVLIIGGGDGGTAREALRYQEVEKVVMVEIDGAVVDSCKEFIPATSSCLGDPRLELRIEDGVQYAKESKEKFDLIIVDSTDPIGPAQPLFGTEFYKDLSNRLETEGLIVSQGESPFYEQEMQKKLFDIMNSVFGWVKPYNFTNMSYPGGLWSFLATGRGVDPSTLRADSRLPVEWKLKYYNHKIHQASFALPQFMIDHLNGSDE